VNKTSRLFLAALLLAVISLACNLPLRSLTPSPFLTETNSDIAQGDEIATSTTTPSAAAKTQTSPPTSWPSATPLPTSTSTPFPSSTFTPSWTPLPTMPYYTPTPPPTITPRPVTMTATATVATPSRTIFNATHFTTPPILDGLWGEWTDRSTVYPARFVTYGAGSWSGPEDLDASFRAAWDAHYLYLAAKVIDDVYAQNATGNNLYEGDSLEVLFDANLYGDLYGNALNSDDYQLGISPGNPDVNGTREAFLWYPRSLTGPRSQVKIASVRQGTITRYEIAIPWSVLGAAPASGSRYGFVLSVSDNDDPNKNEQQTLISSVSTRVLVDPTTWGELVLK
jgi:hypothetical protein